MATTVMTRAGLRPTRSPIHPKRTAPTGRATKPTPKVAKAASVAAVGLSIRRRDVRRAEVQPAEDERGGRAEEEVVVPLQRRPDESSEGDPPCLLGGMIRRAG